MTYFPPLGIREAVSQAQAPDTATGTNAAAVITYPAVAGQSHAVTDGIAWSYSAAPTGGGLTITDGGVTVFSIQITAAGPGSIFWRRRGSVNQALVITLAAGGSGIVGNVNVLGYARLYGADGAPGGAGSLDFGDYLNSGQDDI